MPDLFGRLALVLFGYFLLRFLGLRIRWSHWNVQFLKVGRVARGIVLCSGICCLPLQLLERCPSLAYTGLISCATLHVHWNFELIPTGRGRISFRVEGRGTHLMAVISIGITPEQSLIFLRLVDFVIFHFIEPLLL